MAHLKENVLHLLLLQNILVFLTLTTSPALNQHDFTLYTSSTSSAELATTRVFWQTPGLKSNISNSAEILLLSRVMRRICRRRNTERSENIRIYSTISEGFCNFSDTRRDGNVRSNASDITVTFDLQNIFRPSFDPSGCYGVKDTALHESW